KVRILLFVLLLAPGALWVANRALDAHLDFDSGLYHFASIRWANDYPAVLGLGNLHYRLAFNQSFFLFVAALNVYPVSYQGFHLASSLLVIVLIAQVLENALFSLYCPAEFAPDRLLSVLLLPVILYRVSQQPYYANISSPSPDLPVFILMAVVSLEFARFL